jgi:hypothetical protein
MNTNKIHASQNKRKELLKILSSTENNKNMAINKAIKKYYERNPKMRALQ